MDKTLLLQAVSYGCSSYYYPLKLRAITLGRRNKRAAEKWGNSVIAKLRHVRCTGVLLRVLLVLSGASSQLLGLAQDLIMRSDTTSIKAQVLAVKDQQIFYKVWGQPTGPTTVLSTDYVQYIQYPNGVRRTFRPVALPEAIAPPKPVNLGKNIVSVRPADLVYTNATITYERLFKAGKLGVKVPLTLSINQPHARYVYHGHYQHNKTFSTGLELNFYLLSPGRFRYFIGPAFQYGRFRYSYGEEYLGEFDFFGWNLGSMYRNEESIGEQFTLLLNNGIWYQLGKRFVFSADGGMGLQVKQLDKTRKNLNTEELTGGQFKISANLNLGYQF